jgi:hypothetical protein
LERLVKADAERAKPAAGAPGFDGLVEPFIELTKRIGIEIRLVESAQGVFLAESSERHFLEFWIPNPEF